MTDDNQMKLGLVEFNDDEDFYKKLENFQAMFKDTEYEVTYTDRIKEIYVSEKKSNELLMYTRDYFMVNYNDVLLRDVLFTFKLR